MLIKFHWIVLIVALLVIGASNNAFAFIVINEFLADVPLGLAGDANGDGVRSGSQDEFVEIVNWGDSEVSIAQWVLRDAVSTRHIFDIGTNLMPYECIVLFGGGQPTGFSVQTVTASSGGLSLNNDGDLIQLFSEGGVLKDQVSYGSAADNDQSLVRNPECAGDFRMHAGIPGAQGALFSPGVRAEGTPFSCPTVPEPAHCFLFGLGAVLRCIKRYRRKE